MQAQFFCSIITNMYSHFPFYLQINLVSSGNTALVSHCCCTDVIVMLKWMEIMAKTMEISCNKPELFFKSQTKRVSVHMILLFSCYGYNAQAIAHIRTPGKKNPNPDSRAYREQFFHFEIKLHSVHTVWPTLTHGVLKQQRLPA